jgi:hypothetical protein
MLLPMFGFILALLVVGGLASLVAIGDPYHARLALYVGFVSLFAGVGALCLSLGFAWLIGIIFHSETVGGVGFFVGYTVGGLGGAGYGLRRAFLRKHRIETGAHR